MPRYGSANLAISPKAGRGDGAAVVVALRVVDDDRDEQLRVLGRREADERGDELGVGVGAVDDLLRRTGLAGERVAGDADLRRRAARREHALEHLASSAACLLADHPVPGEPRRPGRRPRTSTSRGVRRMPPSAIAEYAAAICIGVTERPWPIGRLPIVEPE